MPQSLVLPRGWLLEGVKDAVEKLDTLRLDKKLTEQHKRELIERAEKVLSEQAAVAKR